eukprot:scaffold377367_cov39-Prasinocladus_malaysianus.AAC.1
MNGAQHFTAEKVRKKRETEAACFLEEPIPTVLKTFEKKSLGCQSKRRESNEPLTLNLKDSWHVAMQIRYALVATRDCIVTIRLAVSCASQVVDEVELTMKKTLMDQKALHKNLLNSRPTLTSNIAALQKSITKLDKNIQDKSDCLDVDKMAIMVDGRRAPSVTPSNASYQTSYVGTAVSRASSKARSSQADTMRSRMAELEEELAATRRSNQALEERAMILSR